MSLIAALVAATLSTAAMAERRFITPNGRAEAVEINSSNSIAAYTKGDEIAVREFFDFEIFEGGTRLVIRCIDCPGPLQVIADGEKTYADEGKTLNKVRCREI